MLCNITCGGLRVEVVDAVAHVYPDRVACSILQG